ncbi:MAG: hypothetical protein L3J34_06305 [Flavobacteriaceae bacterium]|nr:hypothetical protein [Flavobacteriaceae bacterium]
MKKFLKYTFIIIVIIPLLFIAILWGTYNFYVKSEIEKESKIKVVDGKYCWELAII